MSGIMGIYHLDGNPVDRDNLEKMLDTLAHRGLDGANIWIEDSVGFGHRMLWTTPESLVEKLPLVDVTGNLVITADARIDNREELAPVLELPNRPLEKIADSEFILAAYRKWGEACPEHLLGDFCFVIWDKQQQKLFCARDPMGVKPFYYYRSGNIFAFASEIKALLCLKEVPKQLNETRILLHILGFFEDKTSTFYQNVFKLPGAHSLTVNVQNQIRSYWQPDLSSYLRLKSRQEYAEAYRDVFTQAVKCRMRTAFPLGSMLSGGLDSSSIACVARNLLQEQNSKPLKTFSYIFPTISEIDPRIDERPYINAVLETGGFEQYNVHVDEFSPLVDVDKVFWHLDGAFAAPNLFMNWELFRCVQNQGVRVLFTGHDGDSTVSHGHEALSALARRGQWLRLVQEAKGLSRVFYGSRASVRKLIWQFGFKPLVPENLLRLSRTLRGYPNQPALPEEKLLNPDFARRIGLTEYIEANTPKPANSVKEEHWQGVTSSLLQYSLQTLDKLGSAFGIELRHPFCDKRLVEFCLAVPPDQKMHQGWTRAVMRSGMAGILPPAVQWRIGKGNLSSNFNLNLIKHEQKALDEIIVCNSEILEPYINISEVREAYSRYITDPLKPTQDAFNIFIAANLGLWLKTSNITY